MRKFLAGLALLAPTFVTAQTTPVRGQGGYDTGAIVACTDTTTGAAARCLMPGMIPYDTTGTPLGTAANPLTVTGGSSGGGGNTTDVQGTGTVAAATANSAYTIALTAGRGIVAARISGLSGSGATITVERSNDGGTTWTNANTTESSATTSLSATLTADGQPRINASGATNLRFRVSTVGTGTVSIAYNATTSTGGIFLTSLLPSTTTLPTAVIGGVGVPSGYDVTEGGTTDAAFTGGTGASTLSAINRGQYNLLATLAATVGARGSAASTTAQTVQGVDAAGNGRGLLTSTLGVLASPTAAVANSTGTVTAVAASTSTTVCPATTNPVVYEVQIYGTAPVLLGLDGQALTAITPAAGSGAYMLLPTQYTLYVGPVARTNIITAYTATAQTVVCNIVTRQ